MSILVTSKYIELSDYFLKQSALHDIYKFEEVIRP